jgi:uncharacterized protein YhfF
MCRHNLTQRLSNATRCNGGGLLAGIPRVLVGYEALKKPLPEIGSLSIVTDGGGDPYHVVETIAVDIISFGDVDAAFAYDYGEWDRSLDTWRARCWEINAPRCRALGKMPTPEMPMVCERFVVVYPKC